MLEANHIIPGISQLPLENLQEASSAYYQELDKICDQIQTLVQDATDASYEVGFQSALLQTTNVTPGAAARSKAQREKYSGKVKTAAIAIDGLLDKIESLK